MAVYSTSMPSIQTSRMNYVTMPPYKTTYNKHLMECIKFQKSFELAIKKLNKGEIEKAALVVKLHEAKNLAETYTNENYSLVERVIELESELGLARAQLER